MPKVSQKDIAESLNISRVTVTRALQEHPEIARETIRKVKDRAVEMGYIPDFIGRSLSSKRTSTIGLVVPKIAHSFFSCSIERMYEVSRERGFNIIPTVSFEDHEIEMENIRTLLSMRVDGMILDIAQNSVNNSSYELARQSGSKVVFYDRCPVDFKGCSVVTNDREGSYELTQLLLKKGYKRICHFSGPPYLNISTERLRGYDDAMSDAGIPGHHISVGLKKENGYKALMKLSESGELPDAVFAVNDSVAHGIYAAAQELGLQIPGDIAVAGFGDIDSSAMLSPPMSSVKPPIEKMAEAAVHILVDMIEKNIEDCERHLFKSLVIERDSI